MNDPINLVKAQDKENFRRARKIFILRIISLVFISFVGLVSIILFILYLRISPEAIRKEQSQVVQSIAFQKNKLAKLNLLNDRLRGINQVLRERKNYTTTLNSILSEIPQEARAQVLSINKSNVSLTVTSSSLLPLNKFLNNILELSEKKKYIREMVIESLTIDSKTGSYSLSIKAKVI